MQQCPLLCVPRSSFNGARAIWSPNGHQRSSSSFPSSGTSWPSRRRSQHNQRMAMNHFVVSHRNRQQQQHRHQQQQHRQQQQQHRQQQQQHRQQQHWTRQPSYNARPLTQSYGAPLAPTVVKATQPDQGAVEVSKVKPFSSNLHMYRVVQKLGRQLTSPVLLSTLLFLFFMKKDAAEHEWKLLSNRRCHTRCTGYEATTGKILGAVIKSRCLYA